MDSVPSLSGSDPSLDKLFKGALAGFIATAPMSVAMTMGWRLLPKHEQYHLPPRQITEEISERVGVDDYLNEEGLIGLTIASHFGYGALFGGLYGLFEEHLPVPASVKGALSGLALWAGSYLGWLPAMDILPPATRQPRRRNLLMILAHIVWGVARGEGVRRLSSGKRK